MTLALSDRMKTLTENLRKAVQEEKLRKQQRRYVTRSNSWRVNWRVEMKFQNLMASTGEWLRGEGPHHQVVVSSRVRLARNLRNSGFSRVGKKKRSAR